MSEMEELAREFRTGIERFENAVSKLGSGNSNIMRIEGAGSVWNGIAIGVALGAAIVCTAWVAGTVQESRIASRQAEAYQKAVYALAPRFAEEIDKELDRQQESKK